MGSNPATSTMLLLLTLHQILMKIKDIENKIRSYFNNIIIKNEEDSALNIEIIDDSYKHQDHLEMQTLNSQRNSDPDNSNSQEISHLRIKVRCRVFDDMKIVDRHKLMHKILAEEYNTIHSISFDLA